MERSNSSKHKRSLEARTNCCTNTTY